jgi:outer membrane protein assembly factor BamB
MPVGRGKPWVLTAVGTASVAALLVWGSSGRAHVAAACPPTSGANEPLLVITRDGRLICSFPSVPGAVAALAADGRGGWFVAGDFERLGGRPVARLARLSGSGTVDDGWRPKLPDGAFPERLVVSQGTLFVGGVFGVAALNARTGARRWLSRANGAGGVTTLAVVRAGVFAGGDFTRIAGTSRNSVALLSRSTGRVLGWRPPALARGTSITALAASGRDLYIGGAYARIGGKTRAGLSRVDASSGRVATWTAATPRGYRAGSGVGAVDSMVVAQGEVITAGHDSFAVTDARTGKTRAWTYTVRGGVPVRLALVGRTLYLAGDCREGFDAVSGKPRPNLAAVVLPEGRLSSWSPRVGPGTCTDALAAAGDRVLVAGSFGKTRR